MEKFVFIEIDHLFRECWSQKMSRIVFKFVSHKPFRFPSVIFLNTQFGQFMISRDRANKHECSYTLQTSVDGFVFSRVFHFTNVSHKWVIVFKLNDLYQYCLLVFDFPTKSFQMHFLFHCNKRVEAIYDQESKRIRFVYFDKYWQSFKFNDEFKRCYD